MTRRQKICVLRRFWFPAIGAFACLAWWPELAMAVLPMFWCEMCGSEAGDSCCCDTGTLSSEVELEFSGVAAGGFCPSCTDFNSQVFTLASPGITGCAGGEEACAFDLGPTTDHPCSGGSLSFTFIFRWVCASGASASDSYVLIGCPSAVSFGAQADNPQDCSAPFAMPNVSDTDSYCDWSGATATVTPI